MSFDINEFRANINSVGGVSTNNLFLVTITLPIALQQLMLDGVEMPELGEDGNKSPLTYSRMLTFLCRSVQIPALTVDTAPIQPEGYGNPHRRPSGMTYNELPCVFMVDSAFRSLVYFQRWLQTIINYDTSIPGGSVDGRKQFFMEYKENYQAVIEVAMFSYNSAEVQFVNRFSGAFPTNLGEIQMAWENQAEVMLLPVTFTFDTMTTTGLKKGQPNDAKGISGGILGSLSQLNTIGSAFTSLQRPRSILGAIREVDKLNTILDNI